MTPSLTPDPTSPGTEGEEMRETISRAMCVAFRLQPDLKHYGKAPDGSFCGIAEAGPDVPEHLRPTPRHWHHGWRRFAHVTDALLAGPLTRLHSDITAAREERDEAHRLRKEDRAWYDMTVSVVEEQRDNYRDDSLRLHREKMDRLDRALIAEANLIALAKMYGDACARLQALRGIVCDSAKAIGNGAYIGPECSLDFMGYLPNEIAGVTSKLRAEVKESAMQHLARDLQDDLAWTEIATLRERVAKLEGALGPFSGWAEALEAEFADHDDDVIAGGLNPDVVTFGDLRRARAALSILAQEAEQ